MQTSRVCCWVVLFVAIVAPALGQSNLPTINVNRCHTPLVWNDTSSTMSNPFRLSSCAGSPEQETVVHACYDNNFLRFHYTATDNNPYNPYTNCNDPLYQYAVVETFIAPVPFEGPVYNYIELELSPQGVLFASNITNPNLSCSGFTGANYPCSYFEYSAEINSDEGTWTGDIAIPWKLLRQYPGTTNQSPPSTRYRVNFFRVDTPAGGEQELSSWSCDNASPPCFHMPLYFGYLNLAL